MIFYGSGWSYNKTDEARSFVRHSNMMNLRLKMSHEGAARVRHFQLCTHTRLTALFPGLPRSAGTRKVKTNLDFTEARDSEWQWHQLGRMQVCTSLQTDNHASTPTLSFIQAGCSSCRPTNSVKATLQWPQYPH